MRGTLAAVATAFLLSYAGTAGAAAVFVTPQQGPFDGAGPLEVDLVGPVGSAGTSQSGFDPLGVDPAGLRRVKFNLWIDTLGFTLVGFRLNLLLGGGALATDWEASDTLSQTFPGDVRAIGGGGTSLALKNAGPLAAGCNLAARTGGPAGNCTFDGIGVPPLANPGVMLLGTIEIDLGGATPGAALLEVSLSGARSVFSAAESAEEIPIPGDLLLIARAGSERCEADLGQCAMDLYETETGLDQCMADLEQVRLDLGDCEAELDEARTDFGECGKDLEGTEADLEDLQRQLDKALADTDADGVPDRFDDCSGTRDREVDAVGCSVEQFCNGYDLSTGFGRASCEHADWRNDEPLGSAADCSPAGYTCVAR
jgi:hypothetical protein